MNAAEIIAFVNEYVTFANTRLDAATKQNERATIKGQIQAMNDLLMEIKIAERVAAKVAAALAAQANN